MPVTNRDARPALPRAHRPHVARYPSGRENRDRRSYPPEATVPEPHIGSWLLPGNRGPLNTGQNGFVQYLLYNSIPSSAQNPAADVVLGAPRSTDLGGLLGTVTSPTEYSSCVGQSNFASQSLLGLCGQHIVRGFTNTSPFTCAASAHCLTAPGTAWGTQLVIRDCAGGGGQCWTFSPDSPVSASSPSPTTPLGGSGVIQGTHKLSATVASGSRRCMDDDNNTVAATAAIIWPCQGNNTNQKWYLYPDGTVRGLNSGLCLAVFNGATVNGSPLDQWPCNGEPNGAGSDSPNHAAITTERGTEPVTR